MTDSIDLQTLEDRWSNLLEIFEEQPSGGDHVALLNTRTGECYLLERYIYEEIADSGDMPDVPGWQEELVRLIQASFDDFIEIEPQNSAVGYRDMQQFILTVSDPVLQGKLDVAIQGRGAFRRFKDVLLDYPQERDRWFQFEAASKHERLKAWLDSEDVTCFQSVQTHLDSLYPFPDTSDDDNDNQIN